MAQQRNHDEEGIRPQAVRELFDVDSKDLILKTEISPRMLMTLLRMKLVTEAVNPARTKSLIQIYMEEYMKLMVSFKRKGRLECLAALQAISAGEGEEELPI